MRIGRGYFRGDLSPVADAARGRSRAARSGAHHRHGPARTPSSAAVRTVHWPRSSAGDDARSGRRGVGTALMLTDLVPQAAAVCGVVGAASAALMPTVVARLPEPAEPDADKPLYAELAGTSRLRWYYAAWGLLAGAALGAVLGFSPSLLLLLPMVPRCCRRRARSGPRKARWGPTGRCCCCRRTPPRPR